MTVYATANDVMTAYQVALLVHQCKTNNKSIKFSMEFDWDLRVTPKQSLLFEDKPLTVQLSNLTLQLHSYFSTKLASRLSYILCGQFLSKPSSGIHSVIQLFLYMCKFKNQDFNDTIILDRDKSFTANSGSRRSSNK